MKKNETSASAALLNAYKGLYRELYAICFTVTGSERNSVQALLDVMLTLQTHAKRERVRDQAVKSALQYESNTTCNYAFLDDVHGAPELANEDIQARRLAVMVYGCGVKTSVAAKLTGMKTAEAKNALNRLLRLVRGKSESAREKAMEDICKRELKQFPYAPDLAVFSRSLEYRLQNEDGNNEIASGGRRLVSNIMALIMLLLIGFMLWTGVVLLNYFRDTAQNAAQTQVEEHDASIQGTN